MFDFFNKKKKLELKDNSVVTVQFKADPFGEVDIDINWISSEDSVSLVLAKLLNNINSGTYSTDIVDILSDAMQENPHTSDFIAQTLIHWKDVTSAQTSKEIPIVRPSAFSNNINKNE